jgi:hypothetical protein
MWTGKCMKLVKKVLSLYPAHFQSYVFLLFST